jgi:hypothetical protein
MSQIMNSARHILRAVSLVFLLLSVLHTGCHKAGPVAPTPGADTTSHLFTWKVDTVGGVGFSSTLYDVAIINDTLAYAVGEIFVADSTGQPSNPPCNLAKWNGHTWTPSTVIPPGFLFGVGYAIFAFGPDDIWAAGTIPWHWDGHIWRMYGSRDGYPGGFYITSIWGTSSRDIYFAGSGGGLVHFDGTSWQTLTTGTNVQIGDMWGSGASNPFTGGAIALMLASATTNPADNRILRLHTGGFIDSMALTPTPRRMMEGVWYDGQSKLYVCGDGLFSYDGSDWKQVTGVPAIFKHAVRGTRANDIMMVGDFGLVTHYNGSTWHAYQELSLSGDYRAVAIKGKLVIAVGDAGASFTTAVALVGVHH